MRQKWISRRVLDCVRRNLGDISADTWDGNQDRRIRGEESRREFGEKNGVSKYKVYPVGWVGCSAALGSGSSWVVPRSRGSGK